MSGAADEPLAIIETDRLRVRFEQADGRIRHSIWAIDGGSENMWLLSVDGLSDADEFSTPVLRELHVQTVADGSPTVLAVGAAARDHWSLSAVAEASSGRVLFDVACRVQAQRARLGIAYAGGTEPELEGENGLVLWALPSAGRFRMDIVRSDPSSEGGCWKVIPPLSVEWSRAVSEALPQTLRWQYAVAPVT